MFFDFFYEHGTPLTTPLAPLLLKDGGNLIVNCRRFYEHVTPLRG